MARITRKSEGARYTQYRPEQTWLNDKLKLLGYNTVMEQPINTPNKTYIPDIYIVKHDIVICIDGGAHDKGIFTTDDLEFNDRDKTMNKHLLRAGYKVLRIRAEVLLDAMKNSPFQFLAGLAHDLWDLRNTPKPTLRSKPL